MRPRQPRRIGRAFAASVLLHAIVGALFWATTSASAPTPPMRVYAVDIVSPPPQAAAPPLAGAAAPVPTPEPVPPEPAPEPAPVPPEPVPAPKSAPVAPPEAALPPKPKASPKPSRPTAEAPPKPADKPAPAKPAAAPAVKPVEAPAGKPADEPASKPADAPATGSRPDPGSVGGEGLSVRTKGMQCPSAGYCNNIVRQVKRYFRRPSESRTDRGEVCFRLQREGRVEGTPSVQRLRGSYAFKLALIEAVDQAGRQDEFGALPKEFDSEWLDVCVDVSPVDS